MPLVSDQPRDLVERLNRLSQAVADLTESQAAQNRNTARLLDQVIGQLNRIEANQLAAAAQREPSEIAQQSAREDLRGTSGFAVNEQQQIDGLADMVMALGAALRMSGPDMRKRVDGALRLVQGFDHGDYPNRPNRAARKAIVDKLAGDIPETEHYVRDMAEILEHERAQAAAQNRD